MVGGDYLLTFVLGQKWVAAGKIAICICVYSVPLILSEPLLPIFRSLDRQELRFRLNVLNFILSLGSLFATAALTHNLYLSLLVYSVVEFTMFTMTSFRVSGETFRVAKYLNVQLYSLLAMHLDSRRTPVGATNMAPLVPNAISSICMSI